MEENSWPHIGKWRDLEVRVKVWMIQTHSYLLKGTIIEVEAEALAPASRRHSTIRMLEVGEEPHPFSTKLERRLPCREKTFIGLTQEANAEA